LTTPIRFGTDGWRAIIAEDFTFPNVRAVAKSVALYLKEAGLAKRGLVVGYDTRFASEDFAAAVAEVVAANGVHVYLCDRSAPTPVIGYSILDRKAGGSVVITSSHNPAQWSGFKFRPEYGGSAPPEVLARIEAHIPGAVASGRVESLPLAEAKARGLVETFDPRPPYRRQVARLVDLEYLRDAGLRAVVDSMHGAAAGYIRQQLSGGKTQVREIRAARNPLFPGMHNPEPIARNLAPLTQAVRRHKADVGLATDGDGDRLGVVDEQGEFLNQHQVFALLAYYLLEVRGQRGPLVKSLTTSRMIQSLGKLYGVPVFETPVGFKFLGPKMVAEDAIVAGEESGGYAFRGHLPERDGVVSALYFLDLMARRDRRPSELVAELYEKVGPHFYDRIDIQLPPEKVPAMRERLVRARPDRIAGLAVTAADTTDGFRFSLEGDGWVLFRFSGTEPLLRIYTEVQDEALVAKVLQAGRELVGV
jgi:phosphomannomutase